MRPVVPAGASTPAGVEVGTVIEDGELEASRVDEAAEHGEVISPQLKNRELSWVEEDHGGRPIG